MPAVRPPPPPGPNAVENEEKAVSRNCVVETIEDVRDNVETYPAFPNPPTVESRFAEVKPPPGPNAVEKEEKAVSRNCVVETNPVWIPKVVEIDWVSTPKVVEIICTVRPATVEVNVD